MGSVLGRIEANFPSDKDPNTGEVVATMGTFKLSSAAYNPFARQSVD